MFVVLLVKLFICEVNRVIRMVSKKSKFIKMFKDFRDEIRYWEFLDIWEGCVFGR